jgi:hypothetical protein
MTPKEQRAYELRLSGKTFKEIAKELKYSDASGAYQAYQRAREVVSLENLGEWRLLELERLNAVQNALWDKTLEGQIPSINALLRVFDLRAKLIGLYAPEKIQVQNPEYDGDELNQAVKDIKEMIELGVKYAEEHGIETDYLDRKKRNELKMLNRLPRNL